MYTVRCPLYFTLFPLPANQEQDVPFSPEVIDTLQRIRDFADEVINPSRYISQQYYTTGVKAFLFSKSFKKTQPFIKPPIVVFVPEDSQTKEVKIPAKTSAIDYIFNYFIRDPYLEACKAQDRMESFLKLKEATETCKEGRVTATIAQYTIMYDDNLSTTLDKLNSVADMGINIFGKMKSEAQRNLIFRTAALAGIVMTAVGFSNPAKEVMGFALKDIGINVVSGAMGISTITWLYECYTHWSRGRQAHKIQALVDQLLQPQVIPYAEKETQVMLNENR